MHLKHQGDSPGVLNEINIYLALVQVATIYLALVQVATIYLALVQVATIQDISIVLFAYLLVALGRYSQRPHRGPDLSGSLP